MRVAAAAALLEMGEVDAEVAPPAPPEIEQSSDPSTEPLPSLEPVLRCLEPMHRRWAARGTCAAAKTAPETLAAGANTRQALRAGADRSRASWRGGSYLVAD